MAMTAKSLLDQNQWFQITIPLFEKMSMVGLRPSGSNTRAAVFFQTTNTSSPAQRWQVFHAQNSTYILRSAASQGNAYLSVFANNTRETEIGGTRAIAAKPESVGEEAFWNIETVGNGLFWLKNVANGTNWNLFAKDAGMMAMTSNIQGKQDNQMFNFTRLGKIDNSAFSTIQAPTQTPTKTPGDNDPPTDAPPSSGGLSTGASIGIGVGVGSVVIIAVIVGVMFLLRRRRNKSSKLEEDSVASEKPHYDFQNPVTYGYHHPGSTQSPHQSEPHELASRSMIVEADASREVQIAELGGGQTTPVELPIHTR